MQIGAVAVLAIGCGLAAGVVLPLGLVTAMRDILPVQPGFAIAPWPLVTSALYGLLIAFIRSEEHTSELQSLMRSSYAVFCLHTKTSLNSSSTFYEFQSS